MMSPIQPPAINKRLKIVYLVLGLTGLMFGVLQLSTNFVHLSIVLLMIAAYLATIISLDKDLRREEWVVLPLYSVLIAIIYYTWMSTIVETVGISLVAAVGFGLLMYGLLLTLNILNISTIRTIPLARPANTVLSLYGLAGSFGLFYLTASSQPSMIGWILVVGGSSLLISWPLIWVSLGPKSRFQQSVIWASISALLMMQLAATVSFWPFSYVTSLFLAILLLLILGIFHLQHKKQLNLEMKRQYLLLGGVAMFVYIVLAQW